MLRKMSSAQRLVVAVFVVTAIARLVMLTTYPLMDTTEARYAEMGRKMAELNDWVTIWYEYDKPFLGKPPLSFWATALSVKLFGTSEFAVRLPHFICGLLILWVLWGWLARRSTKEALYAVAILWGSVMFMLSSGLVMTDMWMLLALTLSMRGFWMAIYGKPKETAERWLFFVGIGLGLLAKGPLIFVLLGLIILPWAIITGQLFSLWSNFPWWRGLALSALIAGPWYALNELRNNGFIEYFIIGEHFKRYLIPQWSGDMFGTPKVQPKGMVWVFFGLNWLPWSVLVPCFALWSFIKKKSRLTRTKRVITPDKAWYWFAFLWGIMPLIFFTGSSNIILPYPLPALPGLSLLLAKWLVDQKSLTEKKATTIAIGGMVASLGLLIFTNFYGHQDNGAFELRTAKEIVILYQELNTDEADLIFFGNPPFSFDYYSFGKAIRLKTAEQIKQYIANHPAFIAVRAQYSHELINYMPNEVQSVGIRGEFELLKTKTSAADL